MMVKAFPRRSRNRRIFDPNPALIKTFSGNSRCKACLTCDKYALHSAHEYICPPRIGPAREVLFFSSGHEIKRVGFCGLARRRPHPLAFETSCGMERSGPVRGGPRAAAAELVVCAGYRAVDRWNGRIAAAHP